MTPNSAEKTCCILGHRNIYETEDLTSRLYNTMEHLIIKENVDTFLFGSKSAFLPVCLKILNHLKRKHTHIKRVYVRAEFPVISDSYRNYLLESYDDTYYPEKIIGSGRAVYVERNYHMIDRSRFCVIYYDKTAKPSQRNSGTEIALDYAVKNKKIIFLFP